MYKIYDSGYRGDCPLEGAEQMTFFNVIRERYPDTYGKLAFHVKNEGKRTYAQAATDKANGMTSGVSDIIIPGSPAFVCELKRLDRTKSRLPDHEEAYLLLSAEAGSYACLCYGWEQAWKAFLDWKTEVEK